MLSYRHGFHAGNHADALKHLTLCLILRTLLKKDKPFFVIDTHSGGGYYSLKEGFALKNREFQTGIMKILNDPALHSLVPEYYEAIEALNAGGGFEDEDRPEQVRGMSKEQRLGQVKERQVKEQGQQEKEAEQQEKAQEQARKERQEKEREQGQEQKEEQRSQQKEQAQEQEEREPQQEEQRKGNTNLKRGAGPRNGHSLSRASGKALKGEDGLKHGQSLKEKHRAKLEAKLRAKLKPERVHDVLDKLQEDAGDQGRARLDHGQDKALRKDAPCNRDPNSQKSRDPNSPGRADEIARQAADRREPAKIGADQRGPGERKRVQGEGSRDPLAGRRDLDRRRRTVEAQTGTLGESRSAAKAAGDNLKLYPGSPYISYHLLRKQDRLTLIDLHPDEHQKLLERFGFDKRVKVEKTDGLKALNALLPPRVIKRGLIFIDPSYEIKSDYQEVVTALKKAVRKFERGIYALWYPVLGRGQDHSAGLIEDLKDLGKPLLQAELRVKEQSDEMGMIGSGMLILNYPYTLDESLFKIAPVLDELISKESGGCVKVEVLVRQP